MEAFCAKQRDLLELERETSKEESDQLLSTLSPAELQRRGISLTKVRAGAMRTGLGGRSLIDFEPTETGVILPAHKFRTGDIVSVTQSKRDDSKEKEVEASGIVYRVNDYRITISMDDDLPEALMDRPVRINQVSNDLPYKRMVEALDKLEKGQDKRLVEVLFGKREPSFDFESEKDRKIKYHNDALNEPQKEAISFALAAQDVALIHGPPGTGKTTTVVEIIYQLIQKYGQNTKILACGPSNISVDNLVERLAKTKLNIVRIGHPARVLHSILDYTLDVLIKSGDQAKLVIDIQDEMDSTLKSIQKAKRGRKELYAELKVLKKELKEREKKSVAEILSKAQVILSTLSGAANNLLEKMEFDYVVIDEVSQSLEAECWIAALKGKRLILAGDPEQLPPTIKSELAASKGLSTTLFDRIRTLYGDKVIRLLKIQYRMNALISQWSSNEMYKGELVPHDSVRDRVLFQLPKTKKSEETEAVLMLIDTAGCNMFETESNDDESKFNEDEAKVVQKHVTKLIEDGIPPAEIAIITPYNAQVSILKNALKEKFPDLEIGSVDGFQGREKEAVVISLVRSNENGEVGFLKENRRLNVAITRAKRHVCIIGDSETINKHPFLARIVDYFFENGLVASAEQYNS